MIMREHELSITKQANVLRISRSSVYYLPRPVSAADLEIIYMRACIPPGKSLARPETEGAFLAISTDSGRQRPRFPASPPASRGKSKSIPATRGNRVRGVRTCNRTIIDGR
jgi:hypothetical protein